MYDVPKITIPRNSIDANVLMLLNIICVPPCAMLNGSIKIKMKYLQLKPLSLSLSQENEVPLDAMQPLSVSYTIYGNPY